MEVEQPSSVLQRIKEEDPLQDLQVEEPPLKKVCTGLTDQTHQPSSAPLGPAGDFHPTKQPLLASLVADKYLILDQLDCSSLYSCVNVHTQEELVCKVSTHFLISTDISCIGLSILESVLKH